MSLHPSIPIDRDAGRASDRLADFIANADIDDPLDPSSSDGVEAPATGWFNAGRVMVAVPLYNARADAERVLDAIVMFARSVPAWEFVFIDDGSDDETVSAFQKRLAAVEEHPIASTRGSHWIGHVGAMLLAPVAIVAHRLLGLYRLQPQDAHPRARERRPHASHPPRRKAS